MISNGDRILTALSGGPDSVFLLLALIELRKTFEFELSAAHVNHMIRGSEADNDEIFCRNLCNDNNIKFHSVSINIPQIAKSMKTSEENAGRIERYKYFEELCQNNNYNKIAVAHNMNDSVETVLINMIRGCSLNGLTGIKPVNGKIIRPIHSISKERIIEYLIENSIEYCIDKTNSENIYTRNKIRNVIIESMKQINPSVIETIYSNLENIKTDDEYISSEVHSLNCITRNSDSVEIDRKKLKEIHTALKKRVICDAYSALCGSTRNLEKKHIDILLGELQSGKHYDLPSGVRAEIVFDKLILTLEHPRCDDSTEVDSDVTPPCTISFNNMDVKFEFCNKNDMESNNALYIDYDKVCNEHMHLRTKKPGDKFIPLGMNGSKKLKQLFTELKIPSAKRCDIPILTYNEDIVAVIPYRISDKYKVEKNTEHIIKISVNDVDA